MSNTKIYQKWCKNNFKIIVFSDNKKLSKAVLEQLQNHYRTNVSKHIAHALNLNLYTVRNWFYKGILLFYTIFKYWRMPVSSVRKSGTMVLINHSLRGDGYTP